MYINMGPYIHIYMYIIYVYIYIFMCMNVHVCLSYTGNKKQVHWLHLIRGQRSKHPVLVQDIPEVFHPVNDLLLLESKMHLPTTTTTTTTTTFQV